MYPINSLWRIDLKENIISTTKVCNILFCYYRTNDIKRKYFHLILPFRKTWAIIIFSIFVIRYTTTKEKRENAHKFDFVRALFDHKLS